MVLLVAVLICSALSAGDQAAPWATTVTCAVAAKLENVTMPNGDEYASTTLTFPALERKEGHLPVLRFRARMHYPMPAGWGAYLDVVLNDKRLGQSTSHGTQRLINRGPKFRMFNARKKQEVDGLWWRRSPAKSIALIIFFGPGGEVLSNSVRSDREELYWYVLDISDVVKYKEGQADEQANKLTLTSYLLLSHVRNRKMPMMIEDVAVGTIPVAEWRSRLESYQKQ